MDFYPIIANFQPLAANLTSLSTLTYVSNSFVKMTAEGTFGLDTATYLTSYTETDPVFTSWLGTVTPANWNTAYSQTLEWDGGSTNLVAATGRTSLGLGTAATHAASDFLTAVPTLSAVMTAGATTALQLTSTLAVGTSPFAVTSTTVNTNLNADLLDGNHASAFQAAGSTYLTGSLTSGRIPYASGAQALVDAAALTFDGTNVIGTGYATFAAGLGIGAAPSATGYLTISTSSNAATSIVGINESVTNTIAPAGTSGGYAVGLSFSATYNPALTTNRNYSSALGVVGANGFANLTNATSYTLTYKQAMGFQGYVSVTQSSSGATTLTTAYDFYAAKQAVSGGGAITTGYAFYDVGQTVAGTNWGLGINTQSYINANLSIGKATAPAVALDVSGQITANNVVTGTYFQTSTAITANSTGTVAIVAKDANLLTNNAGWMPIKKSDGTIVYIPYWA